MNTSERGMRWELKQSKPFRHVGEESLLAIRRTADFVIHEVVRTVGPFGITDKQYNVLRILRGSHPGGLPTLEIGDRMIERQPNVTRLLDRLEAKNLVHRERSTEDRRVVQCRISREGLELLARMDEPIGAMGDRLAARLGADEHEHLIQLLERLRTG